ncbi:hypothetical protein BS46_gp142 [Acinetobacter phage BS46]|nr:hypothetical protein BS46_gp142 [Acinetobacter phage BS46]
MFNFDVNTNESVQRVITSAYNSKQRVRIVYGNSEDGIDWLEEYDVIGTIGRSTGERKVPLLINNTKSLGGGAILTANILKIVDVKSKRVLYQHEKYQTPILVKCASRHEDYMYDVYHSLNGENKLHARFKNEKQADNYIAFMLCKRMSK